MADDAPEDPPRQPLRLVLSFVLPLLILGVTWRILASHEPSPLELQLHVVDAEGRPRSGLAPFGLFALLRELGFFGLARPVQLALLLGLHAAGVVLLGVLALARERAPLAKAAPALAFYALFPWFLLLENGVLALGGLALFPLAVLLRRPLQRARPLVLLGVGAAMGALFATAGQAIAASFALLAAAGLCGPRRGSWPRVMALLGGFVVVLGLAVLLGLRGDFHHIDVFADLEGPRGQLPLGLIYLAFAVALPEQFAVLGKGRGAAGAPLVLASVLVAIVQRGNLAELDRSYRAQRQSLLTAAANLPVGFPWIVVNLPLHLRSSFALAVPHRQWPLTRLLALPDTGAQLHVPRDLLIDEWLLALRATREGMVRADGRKLLLEPALPLSQPAPEGTRFAQPLAHMLALGELRSARMAAGVEHLELRDHGSGLGLDVDLRRDTPLRVALLVDAAAVGEVRHFDPGPYPIAPERLEIELFDAEAFALDTKGLEQGEARIAGHLRGYGPILELRPDAGRMHGRILLHVR